MGKQQLNSSEEHEKLSLNTDRTGAIHTCKLNKVFNSKFPRDYLVNKHLKKARRQKGQNKDNSLIIGAVTYQH